MNTAREPPKPGVILATPLNVEESRAQRQQRSQARFRDRGGIFVPSNRNILADILLGKASPLKKPRRSVSASPSRKSFGTKAATKSLTKSTYEDLVTREESSNSTLRRSPRKPGRKSTHDDEPLAGPSTIEQKTKAIKKTTAQKDPSNPKASAKSKPTKSSSRSTSAKASSARKKLNDIPENEDDVIDDATAPIEVKKSKTNAAPAGKAKTKAATSLPPTFLPQPIATTSTMTPSTSRPKPRKSNADLYSGASEDEYVPPVKATAPRKSRAKQTGKGKSTASKPTKKVAGSNKRRAHSQLADIPEEDEEEDEDDGGNQSQSAKKPATHSVKGRQSTKIVLPDTPEQQPVSVNEPLFEQPAPSKRAKATKAKASKAKTDGKGSAVARGKKRAVKEEEAEEDSPSPAQPKQAAKKSASGRGKKRTAQEDEPSEDVSPPQKRVKRSEQDEAKKANVEKSTTKKRPREEEVQDEADVYEKETKRKKLSNKAKDANSKSEVPAKKAPKGAKSKAGSKAAAAKKSRKLTSTAQRKENSVPPEETPTKDKPVGNRRPPKSVLIRIMNLNSLPLVADYEPDEIDFLS